MEPAMYIIQDHLVMYSIPYGLLLELALLHELIGPELELRAPL